MQDPAELKANIALAHRLHWDIISKNDHDLAREIVHEEFVVHGPGADLENDPRGPDGAIKMAVDDNEGDPAGVSRGLVFDHYDAFAAGDKVAFRWCLRTEGGEDFWGIDIIRIKEGKIAEAWLAYPGGP